MNDKRILLVEENGEDIEPILTGLSDRYLESQVVVARSGAEALDYLYQGGGLYPEEVAYPAVILLDIKTPRVDGLGVLRKLKADKNLKRIPVAMLTSSRDEVDLVACYRLGANAHVIKPIDFNEFFKTVKRLGVFWGVTNERPPEDIRRAM